MTMNYNGSQVGVPYVRAPRITINYEPSGRTTATIEQALAVKLADGSVRHLEALPALTCELDLAGHGNDPIPMVSPEDASSLDIDTTLNQTFLSVLAVIRSEQLKAEI